MACVSGDKTRRLYIEDMLLKCFMARLHMDAEYTTAKPQPDDMKGGRPIARDKREAKVGGASR